MTTMNNAGGAAGAGGGFKIASAYVSIGVRDESSAGMTAMTNKVSANVQSTAQIARNAVANVFRGLQTSVGPAILPVISLAEGFTTLGERASTGGQKAAKAVMGIGIGLTAAGGELLLLGSREKQATDQLNTAIENTGKSHEVYASQIEKVVKQQENFGHTAIQTKDALTTLTNATHDPEKALRLMGEAADLAAVRHISLNSAAAMVAKGLAGSGRIFKLFGIQVQTNADGTKDYAGANEHLAAVLRGQAAAAADNFGGHLRALGAKVEDFAAMIGQKFGPQIAAAGVGLTLLGTALQIRATKQLAAAIAGTAAEAELTAAIAAGSLEQAAAVEAGSTAMAAAVGGVGVAEGITSEEFVAASAVMAASAESMAAAVDASLESIIVLDDAMAGQVVFNDAEITVANETAGASFLAILGPIGLAVIAFGALLFGAKKLTEALDEGGGAIKNTSSGVKELDKSLTASGGAFDQNTKQILANTLAHGGFIDKAAKAGVTTKQLIDGITGSDDAYKGLINSWKAGGKPSEETIILVKRLRDGYLEGAAAGKKSADQQKEINDALKKFNTDDQATASSLDLIAQKYGLTAKQADTYLGILGIFPDANKNYNASNQEVADTLKLLTGIENTATTSTQDLFDAATKFGASAGTAADRATMIGAALKAGNGDLLSYGAAVSGAYRSNYDLVKSFQDEKITLTDLRQKVVSASEGYGINATKIKDLQNKIDSGKLSTKQMSAAQLELAGLERSGGNAATGLADAQNKLDTALNESETGALIFGKSLKGVQTVTIDYTKAGAPALISSLQKMQDAGVAAAIATFQHEDALGKDKQAADDAAKIFRTTTHDALVKNAKDLGLSTQQAESLADSYFKVPKDIKTTVEQIGHDPVVKALNDIIIWLHRIQDPKWAAEMDVKTEVAKQKTAILQKNISDVKQYKVPGLDVNNTQATNHSADVQKAINNIKQGKPPGITADSAAGKIVIRLMQKNIDDIRQGKIPGVTANTAEGQRLIAAFNLAIQSIQDKTVQVKASISFSGGPGGTPGPAVLIGGSGGYAEGGPIKGPGGPKDDLIPLWGSNEEYMVNADSSKKYRSLLDYINFGKAPGFAQGGVINLSVPARSLLNNTVNYESRVGADNLVKGMSQVNLLASIFGSGTPGSFSGSQLDWVLAAEAITRTPVSWTAPILRRIMFESGGNPNAINLTDSNAQAGDPSRGLMQTIMSTFIGNHQPGTSMNIFDPVANIAAAINYIKGRYGSIFAIDPPVQGYDDGGPLPPGKHHIENRTGDYEWIFNKKQMQSGIGGINIQHFHLNVQTIKDVQHLLSIIHGIPQAVRSM